MNPERFTAARLRTSSPRPIPAWRKDNQLEDHERRLRKIEGWTWMAAEALAILQSGAVFFNSLMRYGG